MDRTNGIGGSDAGAIMAGDWHRVWEVKTNRSTGDDLSWVLPVQIGITTEALNRRWFERHTGKTVDLVPDTLTGDEPFMTANLDGLVGTEAVFEAKHVNPFAKDDEIIGRYWWQLQHYMIVTNLPRAYLSVIFGTQRWDWFTVEADTDDQIALIEREREFWRYVELDQEPPDAPAVQPNIPATRSVDMTGNNEWGAAAADWLEHREGAKRFKAAEKALKDNTPDDAVRAFGHGIEVKRAKNGALRIGEQNAE